MNKRNQEETRKNTIVKKIQNKTVIHQFFIELSQRLHEGYQGFHLSNHHKRISSTDEKQPTSLFEKTYKWSLYVCFVKDY